MFFTSLVFFTLALMGMLVTSVVWFSKASFVNRITYSFFSMSLMAWVFCFGLAYLFETNSLLLTRLIMVPAVFIPVSFYVFCSSFAFGKLVFTKWDYILHGSVLLLLLLSLPSSLIIKSAYLSNGVLFFETGFLYILCSVQLLAGGIQGYYRLWKQYASFTILVQKQVWVLVISSFLVLLISIFFSYILPAFGYDNLNFYSPLSSIILVIMMAFAIVKHRFLSVHFQIGKSLSWIGVSLFYVGFAFVTWFFLHQIISLQETWLLFCFSLLIFFAAVLIHPLRLFLQDKTPRLLFDSYQDYEELLPQLSQFISACLDKDQLLSCIKHQVLESLHLSQIVLIIPDDDPLQKKCKWTCYTIDQIRISKTDIPFQYSSLLQEVFTEYKLYEYEHLNEKLKDFFSSYQLNLFLPCFGAGELNGLFCLSKKIDHIPFYANDLVFYKILAGHIALAIRHIRPYEDIKASYEKNRTALEKASQQVAFSGLITGISHEIRNPMTGILTRAQCLEKESNISEGVRVLAQDIKKDIFRILNITDVMLRYGSPVVQEKKLLSIEDILEDVLLTLKTKCQQHRIKIKKNLSDQALGIMGDANRLYQVFTNVLVNAIEAMENTVKRELYIQTCVKSMSKEGKTCLSLLVTIQDTGVGMDQDTLKRLYDPFFTTKYANTGLGLSMVAKVVHEHQGLIQVNSTPSQGTCFNITLPEN